MVFEMTARQRTGKKRFEYSLTDLEEFSVWHEAVTFGDAAVFRGKHAEKYARRHAKMLNGLKREEQP